MAINVIVQYNGGFLSDIILFTQAPIMFVGSLDLNNRVPNTGTSTPQRLRRTEPQRPVDLARYAQCLSSIMLCTSSRETRLQRRRRHCKLGIKRSRFRCLHVFGYTCRDMLFGYVQQL